MPTAPLMARLARSVSSTSTWAMMLLGFAGLSYAGYRRAKPGPATLAAYRLQLRRSSATVVAYCLSVEQITAILAPLISNAAAAAAAADWPRAPALRSRRPGRSRSHSSCAPPVRQRCRLRRDRLAVVSVLALEGIGGVAQPLEGLVVGMRQEWRHHRRLKPQRLGAQSFSR